MRQRELVCNLVSFRAGRGFRAKPVGRTSGCAVGSSRVASRGFRVPSGVGRVRQGCGLQGRGAVRIHGSVILRRCPGQVRKEEPERDVGSLHGLGAFSRRIGPGSSSAGRFTVVAFRSVDRFIKHDFRVCLAYMLDYPTPAPPAISSRLLVWWANHSHRYVVPIVGAVSVSLGLSLAIDPNIPWRTYTPPLLVLVGAGTLASGLAALAIRRSHAARAAAITSTPSAATRTSIVVTAPYLPEPFACEAGARIPMPAPGRAVASPDSSITIPTDPGEYLWRSWATPSTHLLVDLVGPVPETAYTAWSADEPTLYEEGEPIFLGSPAGSSPAEGNASSSLGERSAFPSETRATTSLRGTAAEGNGGNSDWTESLSYGSARPFSGSPISNPVHHEAINPTPPHLRPRPSPNRTPPPGHHPHSQSIERGVRCATCRASVADPPKWRRCPDCQRHLCADCVVSALLTYQRGWCSPCAEARNPEFVSHRPSPRLRQIPRDTYVPSAGETEFPVAGLVS